MASNHTQRLNHRIVLAAHPRGLPVADDFRLEQVPLPEPQDGQVLLRNEFLSLDPYMRNLMDPIGPGYAPPVALGSTMVGGTLSVVVESRHAAFAPGQRVLAQGGWQTYSVADGSALQALPERARPSLALGALGMPGFTAYVGLLDIGQPRAGDTVVVAAATGAVGAMVGQIARLCGARVVGIAGGADKCRHAVQTLRFDACLDRRDPDFAMHLAEACPDGIDVYFENVGGDVLAAVLPLLNINARIPVCGFIAHYNEADSAAGPDRSDRSPQLLAAILQKRVRMQGFIILDHYATRHADFQRDMAAWIDAGDIIPTEDIIHGLAQAPAALTGLLQGRNHGKVVVQLD